MARDVRTDQKELEAQIPARSLAAGGGGGVSSLGSPVGPRSYPHLWSGAVGRDPNKEIPNIMDKSVPRSEEGVQLDGQGGAQSPGMRSQVRRLWEL